MGGRRTARKIATRGSKEARSRRTSSRWRSEYVEAADVQANAISSMINESLLSMKVSHEDVEDRVGQAPTAALTLSFRNGRTRQ